MSITQNYYIILQPLGIEIEQVVYYWSDYRNSTMVNLKGSLTAIKDRNNIRRKDLESEGMTMLRRKQMSDKERQR